MSNAQNTGRGFIPKFFTYDGSTEWRANVAYSAKTIVTRNFKVYTSIVNVPSNVGAPEDNPKYWQAAVITDEVMQTIIDELGKLDGDVSGFEDRVQVLENEVGELEVVIDDVQDDVSQLKNALTAVEIVDSASGAIASFADGSDGLPVKGVTVQLEPIQAGSGDPSPDNVRPISGRDSVTVTRTGFNVWDEEWESGSINETTGENIVANSYTRSKNYIPIIESENYYFKKPSNVLTYLFFYDFDKNFIIRTDPFATVGQGGTFAIPIGSRYMRFATYRATYQNDICINFSDQAKNGTYEPGHVVTYPITFPSEAGTVYGGTLDVTNGVLTVTDGYVNLVGGSEASYSNNGHSDNTTSAFITVSGKAYGLENMISDKFATSIAPDKVGSMSGRNANSGIEFYLPPTVPNTTEGILDWFSNNNTQLCYELATPITVQLTAQQMTTLLGQNNVWSDADSVRVDYVADTKLYIAKAIADALS